MAPRPTAAAGSERRSGKIGDHSEYDADPHPSRSSTRSGTDVPSHLSPGEAGAIRAGALDTNPLDRPEPLQSGNELGVAGTSGRERLNAEHAAVRVDNSRNVEVEVGVDPTGDLGVILDDGHCHPFR